MSQWGLSHDEIDKLPYPNLESYEGYEVIIQATLRKVYEEGEKPCLNDGHKHVWPLGHLRHIRPLRVDCPNCWAELKEAGL